MKNEIDFETKEELAAAERDLGIPYLVSGDFPNRKFGDCLTYEDRVPEFAYYNLARADSLKCVTRFRLGSLFLLALADSCSADSLDAGSRRIADLLLQSEAHKWTGALEYDEVRFRVDSFKDYLRNMRGSYYDARKWLSFELRLRFPAVDWARANAKPHRLSEFIDLYSRRCKEFDGETSQQLLELIVRSAEHAFRERNVNAALRSTMYHLLDGVWPGSLSETVYPKFNLKVCREFSSYVPRLFYRGHAVLSARFGLRCPAPDWGAFNADGSRAREFLTGYLVEKTRQPLVWQECLGDLILGSLK